MAVGLGHMFGVRLPQNFDSPYRAVDVSDFWRRWHISLSSCLRDYLYIPLGGSHEPVWLTYRNLMITMLLGGLWHGANTTFVVWGAYHGLLLCAYRAWGHYWDRLPRLMRQFVTFQLIVIGWTFFRSNALSMASVLLRKMFLWTGGPMLAWTPSLMAVLLVVAFTAHTLPNTFRMDHQWRMPATLGFTCLFILCLTVIYSAPQSPFLYFQF
jgi:alginate O-acetyltransferase complex protein AlgI